MGESVDAEEYREGAGEDWEELRVLLEAEAILDAALASPEGAVLPRPFGDYTLLAELGRGASGVVYEAIHRGLGRKVAVKILKIGFDTDSTVVERFRREARACAQVRHDHVVRVYEAGILDDRHFYAMELIEGRCLSKLRPDGDLPEPKAFAAAVAGVADALHSLHEKGIVHRDVKPSNIMVEPSGRMILADFGLARTVASEALTRTGESLGTPLYMSPEQLIGLKGEINGRTDVYGLGATMYAALAGRPAFAADDIPQLMRMILRERPRPLREVAPDVPEPLERIVMNALEKRNEDRYESAAALRDDLLAFARGQPVAGRPVPSWRRTVRTVRRNARWAGPLAAALLILAGWLVLRPPAPAVLHVACVPDARVRIDGHERGSTPLDLDLPRGRHLLELHRSGFEDTSRPLDLVAAQRFELEIVLRPKDAAGLQLLAASLHVPMKEWQEMARERGTTSRGPVEVLYPRGPVRLEDAGEYRFVLAPDFDGTGSLVFRVDGREVWHHRIDADWPEKLDHSASLPKEVRAALRPGVKATWGFVPDRGDPVLASFEVVAAEPALRIAALRRRLAEQDPVVLGQIESAALLADGLPLAAWRRAHDLVKDGARLPGAWSVMKESLEQMGLTGTAPWEELARLAGRR